MPFSGCLTLGSAVCLGLKHPISFSGWDSNLMQVSIVSGCRPSCGDRRWIQLLRKEDDSKEKDWRLPSGTHFADPRNHVDDQYRGKGLDGAGAPRNAQAPVYESL